MSTSKIGAVASSPVLANPLSVRCQPSASLGVSDFGQSGDVDDLYAHFGIDVDTIVGAAFDLFHESSE